MFKSAAEEIDQWADQCRRWAGSARTREQKLMMHNLQRLLSRAALDAEDMHETDCVLRPIAAAKS
jgi:tRNA C32,U32 (ribose-2'-O)-methylase TrmJ